jgi:3',5'-nucleoside bisphosphate phosphatase
MPARQPFTALCQALSRPPTFGRADLHIHTNYSDGAYNPAQVVDLARRSGLCAVAITDHDTLAGIAAARQAAHNTIEIIAGVEISAEFRGRELHLLGYFVRLTDEPLGLALAALQAGRRDRFHEMCARLESLGIALDTRGLANPTSGMSLGRRHLAQLLVECGKAANIREAFQRWLADRGRIQAPKACLPVAEAIELVRGAGGVAAWAHPSYDACKDTLQSLRDLGLQAVEVDYPRRRPSHARQLRQWARELSMAVTGGSDCHGPDGSWRGLGSCGVSQAELQALRELAYSGAGSTVRA